MAGRPTKYSTEYNEQVYKLALLGATDEQIADFFNVCEATLNNWKKQEPEFLESIKRGKIEADARVSESLYKRATGFEFEETKQVVKGDKERARVIEKTVTKKHFPPDPTAAIFWLKNRQPGKWRDKQEIEHSGNIIWHEERTYEADDKSDQSS